MADKNTADIGFEGTIWEAACVLGGVAPSVYLEKLEEKGSVMPSDLDGYVETHWIDHTMLRNGEFQDFIVDRAKKLLSAIEIATGRTISGKDSEEVQQAFGATLK